ncbi:MAG: response regulator [Acetatifactor sp.]|nr:response regulator [Acetatifactor sp.]
MKKILVVDDEPMMLKLAVRALKDSYETVQASSGAEAVELYTKEKPDLVLSDVKMPGMSGYELRDVLQKDTGVHIPFLFMTGGEENEESLSKPVKADALKKKLDEIFESVGIDSPVQAENNANGIEEDKTDVERKKLPEWLLQNSLLDTAVALENCITVEAYLSAIEIFYAHVEENLNIFEEAYRTRDISTYGIKAHGLKSTSRVIGAMELSRQAQYMEKAGTDGDWDYIKKVHESFMNDYRKVRLFLKEHLVTDGAMEIAKEELNDAFLALEEYAKAEDYTLVEMVLDSLQTYTLPDKDKERFSDIKKRFMKLDYDGILELVRER